MLAVLVRVDGWDVGAGTGVNLFAASHDDPAVCHLDGQTWWPTLAKLPTLRYDLFDGGFDAQITAPSSSLTMQTEPWANIGRYMLADARLRLWTGEAGDAWSGYTLRFDGRITAQPEIADGQAQIDFAVDDRWLDGPLLTTYAGTTGAERPAAMKGQAKPLALGAPRYVPGKLVDPTNNVFQVSGYGAITGFEAALERLARFSGSVGNYSSMAALVSATIPRGRWATSTAGGWARLGAPPNGQISFLVGGDVAGPDGWARKPGQLIRRLALLSGGTGKIDDASLDALDIARPYNQSVYQDEQTTARDLIQRIAASVNAVAGVSWLGKLFVLPVGIGSPSMTIAADGSALPPVASVKQIEIAAPWQKLAIGAERAWAVHALSDVAFTAPLVPLGAYLDATTYREGNIVELPDGSQWLYTSTTPTAGHAPPNALYWQAIKAATTAGDIRYDAGETLEDLKPAEAGATNSADPTSAFGDRTIAQGLADIDATAYGLLHNLFNQTTLSDYVNARLTMPDGTLVKTYLGTEHRDRVDGQGYITETISLMGERTADGLGFLLDLDTVKIDGTGTSLAQRFTSISSTASGAAGAVNELKQVLIDVSGGVTSKAVLTLDSNGYVAGLAATNNGLTSALVFTFDSFTLINPKTGLPMFSVSSDGVRASKLIIDTLETNTAMVPARASATSSIPGTSSSTTATPSTSTVLTAVVPMAAPGWIEVTAVLHQGFTGSISGGTPYAALIKVNGTTLPESATAQTVPGGDVPLQGAYYASTAANYTVTVEHGAHTSINLSNRSVFAKGFPFTL